MVHLSRRTSLAQVPHSDLESSDLVVLLQCEQLEKEGEDTLVLCTGSDSIISSNKAGLFVQYADEVLEKFKRFCCGMCDKSHHICIAVMPRYITWDLKIRSASLLYF